MQAVGFHIGIFNIMPDSSVYIGMADGISYIVAEKAAEKGQSLFPLLAGLDIVKIFQVALKEIPDMVFVHIRAYIPVVPVAQNRQVIEKHIRSLQS